MNGTKEITRTIIDGQGTEFEVHQHIINSAGWEYYLGPTESDDCAFGFVMGFANEWGSVYLPELKPYTIMHTKGIDLFDLMPPEDYSWKEE